MIDFVLQVYTKQIKKRWPTGHQFVKFSMVGAGNAALDFLIYLGLTRFFDFWQQYYLGANMIAFAVGTTSSFFFNKYFTFRNDSEAIGKQYTKFWIVALIYITLVQSILYLGVAEFGLHDVLAKVIAMGVGTFWNFFAHKYWSFRYEKGMIHTK